MIKVQEHITEHYMSEGIYMPVHCSVISIEDSFFEDKKESVFLMFGTLDINEINRQGGITPLQAYCLEHFIDWTQYRKLETKGQMVFATKWLNEKWGVSSPSF